MQNLDVSSQDSVSFPHIEAPIRAIAYYENSYYILNSNGDLLKEDNGDPLNCKTVAVNIHHMQYLQHRNILAVCSDDKIAWLYPTKMSAVVESENLLALAWDPDENHAAAVAKNEVYFFHIAVKDEYYDDNFVHFPRLFEKRDPVYKAYYDVFINFSLPPNCIVSTNKEYCITWRSDSKYFAISYYHESGYAFAVYGVETGLEAICTEFNSPLPEIAWQPKKNRIVVIGNIQDGASEQLLFYEKEGLLLTSISPLENVKSVKIAFNSDGDALAITYNKIGDATSEFFVSVFVEHCSHWYRKKTLRCGSVCPYVDWVKTHGSHTKILRVVSKNKCMRFCYNFVYNYSLYHGNDSLYTMGVVDGNLLYLSHLIKVKSIPPVASICIKLDDSINLISFSPNENVVAVLVDTNKLICYRYDENTVNVVFEVNLDHPFPLCAYHIVCVNASLLYFSQQDSSCVDTMQITSSGLKRLDETYQVTALGIVDDSDMLFAEIGQTVHLWNPDTCKFEKTNVFHNRPCLYIKAKMISNEIKIFSLCVPDFLCIDGKEVEKNITSFTLHSNYLLYTGYDTLHCQPFDFKEQKIVKERCFVRSIAIDSVIVRSVLKTSEVILQTPIGHLEAIVPRILVIDTVNELLQKNEYLKAFNMLRNSRIDLNVLYDLNPSKFLHDIEIFLALVANINNLTSFLEALVNENRLKDIVPKWERVDYDHKYYMNKIIYITDRLRPLLEGKLDHALPFMVILLKRHSENIESALELINHYRSLQLSGKVSNGTTERLVKYVAKLKSVDIVLKTSLGMYNFSMIQYLAGVLGVDPLVYIPFLQKFMQIKEKWVQRYQINAYLNKTESAVVCIAHCDNVDSDMISYIERTNLHKVFLHKALDRNSTVYKYINFKYASTLAHKGSFCESGVIFEEAGYPILAFLNYMRALHWKEAVTVIYRRRLTPKQKFLRKLVDHLEKNAKFKEASCVLLNDLNDYKSAVMNLVMGNLWSEAILTAWRFEWEDGICNIINPSIQIRCDYLISAIAKSHEQFLTHRNRLIELRGKPSTTDKTTSNDVSYSDDDASTSLLSWSGISGSTVSKRSKRRQKLRYIIRRNNPYEDVAIIHYLAKSIRNYDDDWVEVKEICEELNRTMKNREKSRQLFKDYSGLMQFFSDSICSIWPPNFLEIYSSKLPLIDIDCHYPPKVCYTAEYFEFIF